MTTTTTNPIDIDGLLEQDYSHISGPDGVRTYWVSVNPQLATRFLEANTRNRRFRNVHVQRLAHDQASGQYETTHQGIAFSREGVLLDGQHRCASIARSKTAVDMLVTTGLPESAQRYMDGGVRRKASDFVEGKHALIRAASARALCVVRALDGELTATSYGAYASMVTDQDIHALLSEEGLSDDITEIASGSRSASEFTPLGPSPLTAAGVLFPYVAETTLAKLRTGTNLSPGDPALALRNARFDVHDKDLSVILALKVFKAVDSDKPIRSLRLPSRSEVVKVPVR